MISLRRASYTLLVALTVLFGIVHAQDVSAPIEDEVRQRLRVTTDINPLGDNAFGENVNLYNGTLSFEQTDIDLKGIGPDITLTRSYSVADTTAPWWREFVDWRMEIPHIETLTTPNETSFFISPATGRCSGIASNGAQPITFPNEAGGPPIELDPIAWWYGYHLDMPGYGQEDLLIPGAQNMRPLPSVTLSNGQVVQATMITRSNFVIACLPTTSNGAGGEGFLAIAPDGTKYYLDWLVYKPANNYGTAQYQIQRNLAMMMVSRVVDRFGNTLTYNY